MDTLQKIKELVDKALLDNQKLCEKGVFSRGREARKALGEAQKLIKEAKKEILAEMKKIEAERKEKKGQ